MALGARRDAQTGAALAEQVSVLVNRAALNGQLLAPERHERGFQAGGTVDDHELRSFQAPCIQIGEELTPGSCAFAAHIPDRDQHLLPVATDADRG